MLCSSWESSGAGKESSPPPSNGLLSCWRGILSRPLPPYSRCCRAEHSPNPSFTAPGASTALHPGTGSSPCPSHRAPSSSLLLSSVMWSSNISLPPRREQSPAPEGGGPAGGKHNQFLPACSSPAASSTAIIPQQRLCWTELEMELWVPRVFIHPPLCCNLFLSCNHRSQYKKCRAPGMR